MTSRSPEKPLKGNRIIGRVVSIHTHLARKHPNKNSAEIRE